MHKILCLYRFWAFYPIPVIFLLVMLTSSSFESKHSLFSRLFIVLVCLLGGLNSNVQAQVIQQVNKTIKPVFSTTSNGMCVVIGNTNTEPKTDLPEKFTAENEKCELKNSNPQSTAASCIVLGANGLPTSTKKSIKIFNSSASKFCIPNSPTICGRDSFMSVRLNWGGRVTSVSEACKQVVVNVAGKNYLVEAATVNGPFANYYTCHVDLTALFRDIARTTTFKGKTTTVTVANITTDLKTFTEAGAGTSTNNTSSSTSGWSLSVVYAHDAMPRRSMMIYDCDLHQPSNREGTSQPDMIMSFDFGKAEAYNKSDSITFVYSAFGAYNKIQDDKLFINKAKALEQENYNEDSMQIYVGEKGLNYNHFNSTIEYKYQVEKCEDASLTKYARGYDLHSTRIRPSIKVLGREKHYIAIPKGGRELTLSAKSDLEHHVFTNAAVVIGAPEVPQVQLISRTDKTSLYPGDTYMTEFVMKVGENSEGLKNVTVSIPFSEYVDTIQSLFVEAIRGTLYKQDKTCTMIVKGHDGTQIGDAVPFNQNNMGNVPKKLLSDINTYLIGINEHNQESFDNDKIDFKVAKLEFEFSNVVVPTTIKNDSILRFKIDLVTKPADSYVYKKTVYVGRPTRTEPEAEVSLQTNDTNAQSIFESSKDELSWDEYRCVVSGNGGIGGAGGGGGGGGFLGGDCPGLDSKKKLDGGIFVRDSVNKNVVVTVNAKQDCRERPEEINYIICENSKITVESLNEMLVYNYDFNVEKLAKQDSIIWEQAKRDSILALAKKHHVNGSRLEQLLYGTYGDKPIATAEQALKDYVACEADEQELLADAIEDILKMTIETSKIKMLFKSAKLTDKFDGQPIQTLVSETADLSQEYNVTADDVAYIYYQSPWKKGDQSCSGFIKVNFIDSDIKAPEMSYRGEPLVDNDTIYLCLEGNISGIKIDKSGKEYALYTNFTETDETSEHDTVIYRGAKMDYEWQLKNFKYFDSKVPGVYKVAVRQQSYNCAGPAVTFYISIADIKIDQGPVIEDLPNPICQGFSDTDSLTLRVNKTVEQKDYNIRWYSVDTNDEDNATYIHTADTVNIPLNKAGEFTYGATFFKDQCESELVKVAARISPMADTIAPDTIVVCQNYKLTEDDIYNSLRSKGSSTLSRDRLRFYLYSPTAEDLESLKPVVKEEETGSEGDTEEGSATEDDTADPSAEDPTDEVGDAEEPEAPVKVDTPLEKHLRALVQKGSDVSMADLLTNLNTEGDCGEDGFRYMYFVAQDSTVGQCPGPGSLITVKVNCYNDIKPDFKHDGDSILFCYGVPADGDYASFLSDKETKVSKTGYKWIWTDVNDITVEGYGAPQTTYKGNQFANAETITANGVSPIDVNKIGFSYVSAVRVDSNNCISKPGLFKLVVDTSINTYPIIADSVIPYSATSVTFEYCMSDYEGKVKKLTGEGYPSTKYIVEWYQKEHFTDKCPGIDTTGVVMEKGSVDISLETVDTLYYCVRQSTPMGCVGNFLTVRAVVHPDVEDKPLVEEANFCQGSASKPVYPVNPNADKYKLFVYDADGVAIESIKPSTENAETLTYYAALQDKQSRCFSKKVEQKVKINPQPHLPLYTDATDFFFCVDTQKVNLRNAFSAAINPLDDDTKLMWKPDSILNPNTAQSPTISFWQVDTVSSCEGEKVDIKVVVDNTINYSPIGTIKTCWGKSFDLKAVLDKKVRSKAGLIQTFDLGYEVFKLNGNTPSTEAMTEEKLQDMKTNVTRHKTDSTRYLLKANDLISGCEVIDTFTVIFAALPEFRLENSVKECEQVAFDLPLPEADYTYNWYRSDWTETTRTLTLEATEEIHVTATNAWGCVDTLHTTVEIYPVPAEHPAEDLDFCQSKEEVELPAEPLASDDAYNKTANLLVIWTDHSGVDTRLKLNTDTMAFAGASKTFKFVVSQKNVKTGCASFKNVDVTVHKPIKLNAPDTKPVCQPDTVDFAKHVNSYLSANLDAVNLSSLVGAQISYYKLEGLDAKELTAEDAKEVVYTDAQDTVKYIYSVTDESGICSASDTVKVTIKRKPTAPVIENGTDTIFKCFDGDRITLNAVDKNVGANTTIIWNNDGTPVEGESLEVAKVVGNSTYTANVKNTVTGCVSDNDTIVLTVAKAIKVNEIGTDNKMALCAGTELNLAETMTESFEIDKKYKSVIEYTVSVDGDDYELSALEAFTKAEQSELEVKAIANDKLTGCKAENTLNLTFHHAPVFSIVGDAKICAGESVDLSAEGESREVTYNWIENNETISTKDVLSLNELTEDKTVTLKMTLKGTSCETVKDHTIKVAITPEAPVAENFQFCQGTGKQTIKLQRSDEDAAAYTMEWLDAEGEDVVATSVAYEFATDNDTSFSVKARQINTDAVLDLKCPSELAEAKITITKHIEATLPDTVVCRPAEVSLAEYAKDRLTTSVSGYQLAAESFAVIGDNAALTEVADAAAVTANGRYQITYKDKNNCLSTAEMQLTFIDEPAAPAVEQELMPISLCQGTDTFISVKPVAGDFVYHWLAAGSRDTLHGEVLNVSGKNSSMAPVEMSVWRQEATYGCESKKTIVSYQVVDSIKTIAPDEQHICYGETLKLDSVAEGMFSFDGNLDIVLYEVGNTTPLLVTNAVAKAGTYVAKASNSVSGCKAERSVKLNVHENPSFEIKGKTIVCENDTVRLVAKTADGMDDPVYVWTNASGNSVADSAIKYVATTEFGVQSDEELLLSATYRITTKKNCVTEEKVKVVTNPAPEPLESETDELCQNTGVNIKKFENSGEYSLVIVNKAGDTIPNIEVNTETVGQYVHTVAQRNRNTLCLSPFASMYTNVHPAVKLELPTVAPICLPNTVNLVEMANDAAADNNADNGEIKNLTITGMWKDGLEITDAEAIEKTGDYKVELTDQFGCKVDDEVKLTFIDELVPPVVDEENMLISLCQGTDTFIRVKDVAGDYEYRWLATGSRDTISGPVLNVSGANTTMAPVEMSVWRMNAAYGCESKKTMLSYQVVDSIKTIAPEVQHLCEGESVKLDSVSEGMFSFDGELAISIYEADGVTPVLVTNAVKADGVYVAKASNSVSGCKAQRAVRVSVHKNPVLYVNGKTTVCENDTIRLVASTDADMETPIYVWTNGAGQSVTDSVIKYIATTQPGQQLEEHLLLTGTYKITSKKNCVTEEDVTMITNPAPEPLVSETDELCQNTGLVVKKLKNDGEYTLVIKDQAGAVVPGIEISTAEVASYVHAVAQKDSKGCLSPFVNMYNNVHPEVLLTLPEVEPVCQPATINLTEIANTAAFRSNATTTEAKDLRINSILLNGADVDATDAKTIGATGDYLVEITDQYGCKATDKVHLEVGLQPESMKVDTGFCQFIGDQTMSIVTGEGFHLQWLDVLTAYPDSVYADAPTISTEEVGIQNYLVRQVNNQTGCFSVAQPSAVEIYPAVHSVLRDTVLCYGTRLDFVDYASHKVVGGTNPFMNKYYRSVALLPFDYTAVAQDGDFVALYTDDHGCTDSSMVHISFARKIEVTATSNAPVCQGDTINVVAGGAEHYIWNGASEDVNKYTIVSSDAGIMEVLLTASIEIPEGSCSVDTTLKLLVNVVPPLINIDTVLAYCQNTNTDALTLTPTIADARVLWRSPADDYATVAQNGVVKPQSQEAGTFVYRFNQQLGMCETEMQELKVTIEPEITDLPIATDTSYCLNEPSAPLYATTENTLYDIVWTNADGDTLADGYMPSTATDGMQTYQARLHYSMCYGKPVPMRVNVLKPYSIVADMDPEVIYCENTGLFTLKTNSTKKGVRQNWYKTIGGVRYDSIVINTNTATTSWQKDEYWVTQSELDGCESDPVKTTVLLKSSSEDKTILLDTCANLEITLDQLFLRDNITDVADTLWNNADSERMDLHANLGHTGTYTVATHNEWGCKATQTIKVNMLKVEDFTYSNIASIYCYDDSLTLHASSSNSTFEWTDMNTGEVKYGSSYPVQLEGAAEIVLKALVTDMPVCFDTVRYAFNTYPKITPIIEGNTKVCVGDYAEVTSPNVYEATWSWGDSTWAGNNFRFLPTHSGIVNLTAVDVNQCPVKDTIAIKTAAVPVPTIKVTPFIHSTKYQLNRDTFEVKLEAVCADNYDEGLSYAWDFGDGLTALSGMEEIHEYAKDMVRLTKPFDVKVKVDHEFGCSGSAITTLYVDPSFNVPNTMTTGDEFMADYEMQIFDRIGNLIYEGIGWRGEKTNGDEAFTDTYFYAITYFEGGDKKIKTGYITLVR